jgi:acyl-CoA thioester hydrolase
VRYAETDQMGVAWHGSYFAWFEVGRTDLLRERGMTYRELEQQDLQLPVIEAHAAVDRRGRPRRLPPELRRLLQ